MKPDFSAPDFWTQPAAVGLPFLPGMRRDHFQRPDIRVFATESGSNNKDLSELILVDWIIPLWRKMHPTGPLFLLQDAPHSHGWTAKLCDFCDKNGVFIVKFPHNSTTMTQCLDVWYFKAFRRIYRFASENLRAAWEFEKGYLDMMMRCQFRK